MILFQMATGFYLSRALYVATKLGIADRLADGPRPAAELAEQTHTNAAALNRVLRLLASAGVFSEEVDGRMALAPLGECLRTGVPGSIRAAVQMFASGAQDAWADLMYCVETGEPAFRRRGETDPFARMRDNPEDAANFDAAMADFTRMVAVAVAAAYDFSPFRTLVDVGGGNGTLMIGILNANPHLRGVVFDRPDVAVRATDNLAAAGLGERCSVSGGDFFASVPSGGDAYVLKHVIHDWNDDRAAAILQSCHRAMGAAGKLLIVEGVYPVRIDQSPLSRGAASNDVNMLVCTGGRQRSEAEFRALFDAAGFTLTRIVPTAASSVIEGIRR
jgi:SAM-dependent methyltransferase